MKYLTHTTSRAAFVLCAAAFATSVIAASTDKPIRAALPKGAIEHILVIDLENENFEDTFGHASPAPYLKGTLLKLGQLIVNYYGTSHASAGNYIAQVSGQSSTVALNNDCIDMNSLAAKDFSRIVGEFKNVVPGTDAEDKVNHPGQVVGDGCVFPAPTDATHGAQTIGEQLDALYGKSGKPTWRAYMEDMGNDPARDYGTLDPMGGAACAHPPIGGTDYSNNAAANDQYATRHNPFMYFHSIIDDEARCNARVVPLGGIVVSKDGDKFSGHLYTDLQNKKTTPQFMFVTPNLCNDAHDATCAAPNIEGTKDEKEKHIGEIGASDLWLKHWMPMIFASPAYQSGKMLVVLTFDEAKMEDSRACRKENQAGCGSPTGPNVSNPGYSTLLKMFHKQNEPTGNFVYPGGGHIGAVLLNKRYVKPGSVNTTGDYNHYSALRSYEDLLGITTGGDDGEGHLGYAATKGMKPFGKDVFNKH